MRFLNLGVRVLAVRVACCDYGPDPAPSSNHQSAQNNFFNNKKRFKHQPTTSM
jgi:hypothetical protein